MGQGRTDPLKARTEALTPVGCDNDQLLERIKIGPGRRRQRAAVQLVANVQDSIDAGVTGDEYRVLGYVFASQVVRGPIGGGKMQTGNAGRQDAVHFFGKWLPK